MVGDLFGWAEVEDGYFEDVVVDGVEVFDEFEGGIVDAALVEEWLVVPFDVGGAFSADDGAEAVAFFVGVSHDVDGGGDGVVVKGD